MSSLLLAVLSIVSFILLPCSAGYALLRLLEQQDTRRHLFEVPGLSFALGICLWAWISWGGYLLQISLYVLAAIYMTISLGLYAYLWLDRQRNREKSAFVLSYWELGVLFSVLLLVVTYYFVGAYQDPSADSYRHLAFIRKIYARQSLSKEVFFLSANVPYNMLNATYSYNAVYPLYAFIAQLFNVDPALIWLHAPAVLIPLVLSAYYLIAFWVFKKRRLALMTVGFLLGYWVLYGHGLRALGHPYSISFIVHLMLIAEVFHTLDQREWSWGRMIGLVFGAASLLLLHPQWWGFLLVTISVLCIHLMFRREFRSSFIVATFLGAVLLASLPLVWTKLEFYQAIAGHLESVLLYRYIDRMYFLGNLYAFNPFKFFSIPLWFFVGMATIVLAWSAVKGYRKIDFGGNFAALMVGTVAFLLINPLTVFIISQLATTTITARMAVLIALWGILLLTFTVESAWPQIVKNWQRLSIRLRHTLAGALGVGLLAYFGIQPLLELFFGIQTSVVRQKVVSILVEYLGIPHSVLTSLTGHMGLWIILGSVSIGIFLVLAIWKVHSLIPRISWGKWLRKPGIVQVWGPLLVMVVLLLAPGSKLSPWRYWVADSFYAQLYGPTLTQVISSPTFRQMFSKISEDSIVVTDARNLVLAFKDVRISGDVHGELPKGKEINEFIQPIFTLKTPIDDVIARLFKLSPDYLILSPRYSHLGWMKYDHFPEIFQKIFDEKIPEINFFNNEFVIYRIRLPQSEEILEKILRQSKLPEQVTEPRYCSVRRVKAPYQPELTPQGWVVRGDELNDGDWNTTRGSLLWIPLRETWFYVEFDLGKLYFIDKVLISNTHFTSSYHLYGLAVFLSKDRTKFYETSYLEFDPPPGVGEHTWNFRVRQRARYVRIAVHSEGTTTLGEVQIYVCQE